MPSAKILLPIAAIIALAGGIVVVINRTPVATPEPARPLRRHATPGSAEGPAVTRSAERVKPTRDLLPAKMRHDFDLQEKGYLAAREGMDKVLAGLEGLASEADRESFLRGAFHHAASLGVPDALDRAWHLESGPLRDTALLTLLCQWSDRSTMEIMKRAEALQSSGIADALGRWLLESGRAAPVEVVAFAWNFVPSWRRTPLIAAAAAKLAATDPAAAMTIGDGLSANQHEPFLRGLAQGWSDHDPLGAMQWSAHIADAKLRAEWQSTMVDSLSSKDLAGAARFVQTMPRDDESRMPTLEKIAGNWAMKDTRAAIQWADSLADTTDRSTAQQAIQSTAPVGIGVALIGDTIQAVIPDSAANNAGLAEGDRITAFSDADGSWVETSGLDEMDLVQKLRGAPNTKLTLQVKAKAGGAPKTMTLTRQQIMLKQP